MLFKSAPAPRAVFASAVLLRRAPPPTAVLKLPSVLLPSDKEANRRVERAAGETKEGVLSSAVLPPG